MFLTALKMKPGQPKLEITNVKTINQTSGVKMEE